MAKNDNFSTGPRGFEVFPQSCGGFFVFYDKGELYEETFKKMDECKTYFDDYFEWVQEETVSKIYDVWGGRKKEDLFHTLREWLTIKVRVQNRGCTMEE